jgi:hypothetical protein
MQYDFDTLFEGETGSPAVQVFAYGDNVLSVFAQGRKMVVFKDGKPDTSINLDSESIDVLHMIVESPKSQIVVIAKTANALKTYIVSLANGF